MTIASGTSREHAFHLNRGLSRRKEIVNTNVPVNDLREGKKGGPVSVVVKEVRKSHL